MISTIITLLIGTIVFIVLSVIFSKSNSLKLKNKSILLSLVISIILTVILSFVPFENAFMSFSSPQKAFSYPAPAGSPFRLEQKAFSYYNDG